ncbi:YtxH domain-containing protein [Halalkalibacter kiskunsagensis]|uniref:YtxH domain-containing protein n=1 Tax=Halalkalibacter kiskunsagensis TaxID=1548599 RepID=A0ABV6KK53_9BACI
MNAKSFFSGFLAGSAILGMITLFTTPTSGKNVRATCKENTLKLRNELDQLANDSKNATIQLKTTAKEGKEAFLSVGSEVKDSINKWQQDIEPTVSQLKADIEALQKNVEQATKITTNTNRS